MTSTSTGAPFAEATTSSLPPQPYQYINTQPSQGNSAQDTNGNGFTSKEVIVYFGGLVLTAVITYFSTLISVKSDISTNRESISIIKVDMDYAKKQLDGADKKIEQLNQETSKIAVIETKIQNFDRTLDKYINSNNSTNSNQKQ